MNQTNNNVVFGSTEKKRISTNEFLFVLYFCSFSFLKPITTVAGGLSTLILLATTGVILMTAFIHNGIIFNANLLRFSLFAVGMLLLLATNMIFFNNSTLYSNAYDFCIYGLIPMLLLINVRDFSMVLKYWVYMTFAIGILFLLDPFFGYRWSGGYMPLGFNQLLPAFASCMVIWLHYRKKWFMLFSAVFLIATLVFANKGSFIAAVAFGIVFFLYIKKQRKAILLTLLGGALLLIIAYQFRFQIFDVFYDFALQLGVPSYSMATFREMLYVSPDRIFALRTDIWDNCLIEIQSHPIFGIGVGAFQSKYGLYPHNIFLDILTSAGWIIFIPFVIILIVSLFSIKKMPHDKKIFMIMILFMWIIPMQMSLNMWNYMIFWIYFGVFMFRDRSVDNLGGTV